MFPAVRVFKLVVRALVLFGVLLVGYFGVTAVQVWLTSRHSDLHSVQAEVVMGSAEYNGVPSPDLQARLQMALNVWNQGYVHTIVVTGSKQPGDVYTESEVGAMWLEARGVPSTDVVEVGGSDSWQNLSDAGVVLKPSDKTDLLVVTDGFHEDRSLAICTELGLNGSPVPAVGSPISGWGSVPYFAKETVGVGLGRVIGYDHLEWIREA